MHSKRAVALALVLMGITWLPAGAAGGPASGGAPCTGGEAGRAGAPQTLANFTNGLNATSVFFAAPGNDSTTGIALPANITVTSAFVDLTGQPHIWNGSFCVTTQADFNALNCSWVDTNITPGSVSLRKYHDDAFDDGVLDARWRWLNQPTVFDENTSVPGWLRINSAALNDFWGSTATGHQLYQQVASPFNIVTKLNITPALQWQRAGLMMMADASNWMEFSYGMTNSGTALFWINTTSGASTIVTQPLAANPLSLSIWRDGSTFRFFYSTDGSTWTRWDAANSTRNMAWTLNIGPSVTTGGANQAVTADFDYFWCNRCNQTGWMESMPQQMDGELQSIEVSYDATSPQWCGITPQARTSPYYSYETLSNGALHPFGIRGKALQYNITLYGPWAQDNTPVLREVRGNYTLKDVPINCSINIGGGAAEWSGLGSMPQLPVRVDFRDALEAAVHSAAPGGDGNVSIPMELHSEGKGTLKLTNLTVKYVLNKAPNAPYLEAPENGTWCTDPNPTFRCNATDPDADTIWYYIELYRNGSATPSRRVDQRQGSGGWSQPYYRSGEAGVYRPPAGSELDSGERYSWRAAAWDGYTFGPWSDFRVLPVDATPPAGTVVDDGNETDVYTRLHAVLNLTDPESGVVKYQYKLGTNTNSSDLYGPVNTTSSNVTVTNLDLVYGRKYYFTARALNGAGLWSAWISSNGISLDKGVINHLPTVAIAAPPDGANLTGLVQVNGTADDLDFLDLLTVQLRVDSSEWADVQGNRTWFFSFDTTLYPNGRHTLVARAYDQTAYSPMASINVTVENKRDIEITSVAPPPDPRIYENESQVFSVNARDPFGHELRYQWVVDGNPQPGSVARTFTYSASYTSAGVHTVRVSVLYGTKEAGWNWTLTVLNLNRPPVAVISAPAGGAGFTISRTISFDSAGSTDPDTDDVLNFTWNFGDGSSGYGPQATHIYTKPGKVAVTLTLSDGLNSTSASIRLVINEGAKVQKDFFTQALSEPWCPLAIALGMVCLIALAVAALRSRRAKPAGKGKPDEAEGEEAARKEEAEKEARHKEEEEAESPLAKIEEEAREAVRRQAEEEAAIPEAEAAPVAAGSEPQGRERAKGRGAPAGGKAPPGDGEPASVPEAVALPADESSKQTLPLGRPGTKAPPSKKPADSAPAKGTEPAPKAKKESGPPAPEKAPEAKPPEAPQPTAEAPKPEDLSALLGMLGSDKPLEAPEAKKESPKREEPEKEAPKPEAPKREEPRKEPERPREEPKKEAPKEPEKPKETKKEAPKPSGNKLPGSELTDEALADLLKKLKS